MEGGGGGRGDETFHLLWGGGINYFPTLFLGGGGVAKFYGSILEYPPLYFMTGPKPHMACSCRSRRTSYIYSSLGQ
jgi:hypothetical protein